MASPKLTVVEARREDLAAILALYQAAGITGAQAFDVAEAQAVWESFARYPFYRVYLARLGPDVVGTFELIIFANLAKAGAKTAVVEDVAVHPTQQKKGVGRAMMAHALAVAKAEGAYKLALSSNLRRKEAHAFYAALGFAQHGISFVTTP